MVSKQEYSWIVNRNSPKSKIYVNCAKAFFIGGGICAVGQVILGIYDALGITEKDAKLLTSVTLIFIGIALTAAGVYTKIAKHAGAGTLVPITGFANAVVAPALEAKNEGFVLGTAAQMFSIAGPVIVFGCGSAALYGLIYWVFTKAGG